jgi:hypothetical protein
MSDSYQAIYDAVRSKIGNGDIGSAVESAIRDANVGHYFMMAGTEIQQTAAAHAEPSAIYRPKLSIDGNQWCALYGENLQEGVAGFGDSPAAAMRAFDVSWHKKLTATGAA